MSQSIAEDPVDPRPGPVRGSDSTTVGPRTSAGWSRVRTGPGPYERAKERGVKLVGATAHYATEDLDEGPIIEQDVVRVSHRQSAAELARRGADIERNVLARAVRWRCEDRVLLNGRTTIVF